MRVLHIWNTAGVAGFIAQAMDELHGTRSKVMMRSSHDPFECTVHGKNYEDRASVFILRCLAHCFFTDVVHVHSMEKLVPWIKRLTRRPVFLHYHGSIIRGLWPEKRRYWRHADEIFVSTSDLLEGAPEGTTYIPNVVNEKLLDQIKFPPRSRFVNGKPVALHDSRWADEEAHEYAEKHGYEILDYSRTLTEGLPHIENLKRLAEYEAYIDVKRDFPGYGDGEILRAHSLTGLEALYLGLNVIRWDGELIDSFPNRHRAEEVVATLYRIYGKYVK
jgi:hypothetical protein